MTVSGVGVKRGSCNMASLRKATVISVQRGLHGSKNTTEHSRQQPKELTKKLWSELLPRLEYVLSDCDGVLWHSNLVVSGARDTFRKLREYGLKVGFVTNNSTKSKAGLLDKFKQMNFQITPREIFCVNNLTASYLQSRKVKGRVYMLGTEALQNELEGAGLRCNPPGPDLADGHPQSWLDMKMDTDVEAVVLGFDYHFSMAKVCRACTYLARPNCHFIASEADVRVFEKNSSGIVLPSTGAILAAIEAAAGRRAVIIGKPSTTMIEMIRREYPEIRSDNTLFIGDYLHTDIAFGAKNGFTTLLVETGMHSRHDLTQVKDSSLKPTFYTKTS
ncbi:glycerol-3-phosphate phosphatase-like isoform X2 [Varroa destructor]|uniref:4-nitrophenylphosphatase n=1 Tax=Varroa destructor TaxID=109461 RepID=A0A7M7JKY2_VARDE|nr:glycerol-3-phosphate phosphatase-like isoform X2 [Varroa destructor]